MAKRKTMLLAADRFGALQHCPFEDVVILFENEIIATQEFPFVGIGRRLFIGNHPSPPELILAAIAEKFLGPTFPPGVHAARELLLANGFSTRDCVVTWTSEAYHFDTPDEFRPDLSELVPSALSFCLPVLS